MIPVIVLGLGPSGLFLVRCLKNITDNIYAVGRHDDIGMYSKYVKKNRRYIVEHEKELIAIFQKIQKQESVKPILYICSDQYLTMLLLLRDTIESYVCIFGSGFDVLEMINNKSLINSYCKKGGIKIPYSCSYSQFVDNNKKKYPIVIKWNKKQLNNRHNPIGKIKICNNQEEFNEVDSIVGKLGINRDELFIQTYIRGNNNRQYSVGGVYKDGELLAGVTVLQARQYPQGISAEVLTIHNSISQKLMDLSISFAKEIHFSGFLEMEYKIDNYSDEIYLLDVNPRPWGWVSILGKVFPDFYKVLQWGRPQLSPLPVLWKSPIRRFLSVKNRANVRIEVVGKYLKAYDIYDKSDIIPSFAIFLIVLRKIFG